MVFENFLNRANIEFCFPFFQAGNYCNGPLKPGGVYRFKIRAYTSQTQFSETHWSQPIQTDPDNTAFLVGIIIPIILLLLVALVVLGIRRMRNR